MRRADGRPAKGSRVLLRWKSCTPSQPFSLERRGFPSSRTVASMASQAEAGRGRFDGPAMKYGIHMLRDGFFLEAVDGADDAVTQQGVAEVDQAAKLQA